MESNEFKKPGKNERGSLSGNLLLWLLGVPIPVIILISLLRGCK